MKNALLLFAILFSSSATLAQQSFREGYIVTLQNDTIVGHIIYKDNPANYKSCKFRRKEETVTYYPEDIQGFGFEKDKFFTSSIEKGLFIQVLVTGELSLYRYKSVYYLKKNDKEVYRLEAKNVKEVVDGIAITRTNNKWRSTVSYLIGDCIPNPSLVLKKVPLKEKSLTQIVARYNECKNTEYTLFKEQKPWTVFKLGITAGLTRSGINISIRNNSFSYLDKKYHSVAPTIGLVTTFSFPRASERLAFQSEFLFTRSGYSSLVESEHKDGTDFYDSFIDLTTLSIPVSLRYTLIDNKYSFFVQGGGSYDYHIKRNTAYLKESVQGNVVHTSAKTSGFDFGKNYLGFWGGIGVLKSFTYFEGSANFRYFQIADINSIPGLTAGMNKLTVSIILYKK
ncbi:outer membrane beta-barrel protein [Catalinimonas niigatensis]|uniref:outer membrane beta-barrel protein n=1 Tax=Catalinimonas niigatensis TaxID=1397264 RepID=UPI002665DBBC|nr:hypothetical protein [Catalinimonas niigatensis]WPP48422.1 hypothetical protein PZB72_17255 [Catalinimonas niigatensis]